MQVKIMQVKKIVCFLSSVIAVGFLGSILTAGCVFAAKPAKLVNSSDQIQNLDQTMTRVKKDASVPVLFPQLVPQNKQKYFANNDSVPTQNGYSYWINVDATADCNGVKYCNIGNLTARKDAQPEQFVDKNNKSITEQVKLSNGKAAYFTPGHPMGDYVPANIQWMENDVLYSLTWSKDLQPKDEKSSLIAMANSAIASKK